MKPTRGILFSALILLVLAPLGENVATDDAYRACVEVGVRPGGRISSLLFGTAVGWDTYEADPAYRRSHLAHNYPQAYKQLAGNTDPWGVLKDLGVTLIRTGSGNDGHRFRWNSVSDTLALYRALDQSRPWHREDYRPYFFDGDKYLRMCRQWGFTPLAQVATLVAYDP